VWDTLDRTLKAIRHFVLLPRQIRLPIAHLNIFSVIAVYTHSVFSATHMDVVQGRVTLTEIAIARTCWFASRPKFFPTEGHHLMPAMIKISAAEISMSWRCPGGKQHVRPHVGLVCPSLWFHLTADCRARLLYSTGVLRTTRSIVYQSSSGTTDILVLPCVIM